MNTSLPTDVYRKRLRARAQALATICAHAGDEQPRYEGALDAPIVMSTAFEFDSAEQARQAFCGDVPAYIYGRWANPTVDALERTLARLEGGEAACATASGMAAISGVLLALCQAGDRIVAARSMYAESARLFSERLPRLGIQTTFVDGDVDSYAEAIDDQTRAIYIETPSNPMLRVTDIARIAEIAKGRSAPPKLIVDSTFATPFAQTPLALGADVVVHSMTKALSGHGDVIGGAIIGDFDTIARARDVAVRGFGGVLSPMSAWLVARGLRTFALRQEQACATAASLAQLLSQHESVGRVFHPSLATAPDHALATTQMHAFGSVLSFEVSGPDPLQFGRAVLERLQIATHAVSLGDVRTLVVHPASTTHASMPAETRRRAGIGDGLLRVSCGVESEADVLDDFASAMRSAASMIG